MKVWRCLALAGTRPINPTAQARAPGNNNNQDYWRSVLNLLVILACARHHGGP